MESSTKMIADEFIKDHGKGRLALKFLTVISYIVLSLYVIAAASWGLKNEPGLIFFLILSPLGYMWIYLVYYVCKSVLLMRDRMSIVAKRNGEIKSKYFTSNKNG